MKLRCKLLVVILTQFVKLFVDLSQNICGNLTYFMIRSFFLFFFVFWTFFTCRSRLYIANNNCTEYFWT